MIITWVREIPDITGMGGNIRQETDDLWQCRLWEEIDGNDS